MGGGVIISREKIFVKKILFMFFGHWAKNCWLLTAVFRHGSENFLVRVKNSTFTKFFGRIVFFRYFWDIEWKHFGLFCRIFLKAISKPQIDILSDFRQKLFRTFAWKLWKWCQNFFFVSRAKVWKKLYFGEKAIFLIWWHSDEHSDENCLSWKTNKDSFSFGCHAIDLRFFDKKFFAKFVNLHFMCLTKFFKETVFLEKFYLT